MENEKEVKEDNKEVNNQEDNRNRITKRIIGFAIVLIIVVSVVLVMILTALQNKETNNRNISNSSQRNSTTSTNKESSSNNSEKSTNSTYSRTEELLSGINEYSAKPIIYLYPKETTELTVKLGKPENITCSYPKYVDGWNVIANIDGSLIDKDTGRELYSLYWEGINSEQFRLDEGFVVKGSETIEFLEEKLAILGLNEREAEEFIVYWLPILEKNEYNYIRFATIDEINKNMPLEFSVKPDTIIRVLMQYKALDNYIEVKEQKLETPERTGFVAVEWGGTEIKQQNSIIR